MGKKNSSKPRGKMTSYAFFVQACREEHEVKHPNEKIIFAEFSKKCAERWKTMTDKEKRRFNDLAEKDKVRYENEVASFGPIDLGRKRKKKDTGAPKRAVTAFFYFCHDERPKVRAEYPNFTVGDISKELGKRWKDVSKEVKSKYESMAAKDKQRYEKEARAFKDAKQGPSGSEKSHKKVKREESEEEGEEDEVEEEEDEEEEEDDDD